MSHEQDPPQESVEQRAPQALIELLWSDLVRALTEEVIRVNKSLPASEAFGLRPERIHNWIRLSRSDGEHLTVAFSPDRQQFHIVEWDFPIFYNLQGDGASFMYADAAVPPVHLAMKIVEHFAEMPR